MPSCRHVSLAMAVWSPVIILTSMPLATAASMVVRVSLRGGSNSGTMPTYSQRSSPTGPLTVDTPGAGLAHTATPSAR